MLKLAASLRREADIIDSENCCVVNVGSRREVYADRLATELAQIYRQLTVSAGITVREGSYGGQKASARITNTDRQKIECGCGSFLSCNAVPKPKYSAT